jgi:hypothetical protein
VTLTSDQDPDLDPHGFTLVCSVAERDVYFGSRIPDPDFYPSRIPDPKTASKERGEKKFVVLTFYVATIFTKFKIIFVLRC